MCALSWKAATTCSDLLGLTAIEGSVKKPGLGVTVMTSTLGAFGSSCGEALALIEAAIAPDKTNLDSMHINADAREWAPDPHGFQSWQVALRQEGISRNNPIAGEPGTNSRLRRDTCSERSACRSLCLPS